MSTHSEQPSADHTSLRSLLHGSALVFVGRVIHRLLRFGVGVAMSRVLGAERYGVFSLALTVETMGEKVAESCLSWSVLKYVAHYDALGQKEELKGTVYGATLLNGAIALVMAIAVALLAPTIAQSAYGIPELAPPIRILAIALPFAVVQYIIVSALRGVQRIVEMLAVGSILAPGALLAGIVAVGLLRPTFEAMAWVHAGAAALGCVVGWHFIRRTILARTADVRSRIPWAGLLSFGLPMLLYSIFSFGGGGVDILVLGKLLTKAELGIYSAAWRGANMLVFPLAVVQTVFSPTISALHAKGDIPGLRRTFIGSTAMATYLAMWVFGAIICWPHVFMGLFGDEFVKGSDALVLVCAGQLANSATGSVGSILTMTGRPWIMSLDHIAFAIAMMGLFVAWVPRYRLTAASAIVAAALAGVNLWRVVRVWRLYRILPYNVTTIALWPAFLIGLGLAYLLLRVVAAPWGAFAAFGLFALPMFAIGARLARLVRPMLARERKSA